MLNILELYFSFFYDYTRGQYHHHSSIRHLSFWSPRPTTKIWYTSMNESAFMGAVGSSIHTSGDLGEVLTTCASSDGHTNLGPTCVSHSSPWSDSSPSQPWFERTLSWAITHGWESLCECPVPKGEISALHWKKIVQVWMHWMGKKNSFISSSSFLPQGSTV